MILGGYPTVRQRLAYLGFLVLACSAPAVVWYALASLQIVGWPISSDPIGLSLGIIGAAMIAFEMLIWPRKKLRRFKLGKTRRWLVWHVWVGLFVGPIGILHSGFHWGGPLTTVLMILFLGVLISGIWGLAMQQALPQKLLDEFPNETIEGQVDTVMIHERREAEILIRRLPLTDADSKSLLTKEFTRYLEHGNRSGNRFRSEREANQVFGQLAQQFANFPSEIARLRSMCDDRRRYDRQARIHWWLHNWLCVHLPLSVALCVVLVFHIVTALKYW